MKNNIKKIITTSFIMFSLLAIPTFNASEIMLSSKGNEDILNTSSPSYEVSDDSLYNSVEYNKEDQNDFLADANVVYSHTLIDNTWTIDGKNSQLISSTGEKLPFSEIGIGNNVVYSDNGNLGTILDGYTITSDGNLINSDGLLVGSVVNLLDENEIKIDENGNLVNANNQVIGKTTNIVDSDTNTIGEETNVVGSTDEGETFSMEDEVVINYPLFGKKTSALSINQYAFDFNGDGRGDSNHIEIFVGKVTGIFMWCIFFAALWYMVSVAFAKGNPALKVVSIVITAFITYTMFINPAPFISFMEWLFAS